MIKTHLEKLFYFQALVEEKSFLLAAQRLNISQPALSKSIKVLEGALNSDLVIRSKGGVQLTEKGKVLYRYARKLATELPDVEKQILELDSMAGQLKVGTYETLGISFWPRFLKHLSKETPSLSLSITTSDPESHWSKLNTGELHLILDAEPPLRENYYSKIIYKDKFALFKSTSSSASTDLSSLCYVKKAYDQNGKSIERNLIDKGYEHKLRYDLDSFVSVREIILEGISIGVLPLFLATEGVKKGKIKVIPNTEFGAHRICVTCLESRRQDKRIKYLMKSLQQVF